MPQTDLPELDGVTAIHGLPVGPLEAMVNFHFMAELIEGQETGILCIDSAFIPPTGIFSFLDMFGGMGVPPDYNGPYCWPVKRMPLLGDFDLDGLITVGDIVYMIAVIFKGAPIPVPSAAGDVNCDGSFNVGDAIYLINYIFKFGPAPGCP